MQCADVDKRRWLRGNRNTTKQLQTVKYRGLPMSPSSQKRGIKKKKNPPPLTRCGGLSENGPYRLLCLNTWPLVGRTIWEDWKVWPWRRCVTRVGCEVSKVWSHYQCVFSAVPVTMLLLHHQGLYSP